jgi:hypothetical protein
MKRLQTVLFVCLFTVHLAAFAGLGTDKIAYVGGTETDIREGSEGAASTGNEKEFVFECEDGELVIPYDKVNDLEYGQQAGRRVRLSTALDPFRLLSKQKKHFLTIGWTDDQAKQHAAVFELGKSIIKSTIVTLESRTGKKVDYQDEDARKSGLGGM